ncbi:unnamed protein product [Urochloa humidicola]
MDLNQLPPEFDYDFLDLSNGNPSYCTQPVLDYTRLLPNLDPIDVVGSKEFLVATETATHGTVAVGGGTESVVVDNQENGLLAVNNASTNVSGQYGYDDGNDITHIDAMEEDVDDQVWCTPPIPYTGQTFASKKEARDYYIWAGTREQRKVTYVCNKEGYGRKGKEGNTNGDSEEEELLEELVEEVSEDENTTDGAEKKRKKMDGGKKRKREKMKHTNCKAKLVLNLIGERWQVTQFAPEHNHELILKPSLKKFLRSHKGILQEEKQFIILLHDCNLSTGRIMQLINEFYGSAQVVPYEGKDVSNFRSTIRRTEKYLDMKATIDYFMEIEEEDPEFFFQSQA